MKASHTPVMQVKLSDLRPTQGSIGRHEVEEKLARWQRMGKGQRKQDIARYWLPSVLGPGQIHYITDQHHTALALLELGVKTVPVVAQDDWSGLDEAMFWRLMDYRRLAWPYDADSRRISFARMPTRLDQSPDDPYRSLAGLAQQSGAFAKELASFGEFMWAEYFRQHIPRKAVQPLDGALVKALELARGEGAKHLPGWTGEAQAT